MSSMPVSPSGGGTVDDRTTKARIRDAAVLCFAKNGIAGTTARKVAAVAGVSPGLVIHHFGSMEDLRLACDEHVAATIRQYKQGAMAGGPNLDILAALRDTHVGPLMGYLARVLTDDSSTVARLVDDLVDDAEHYIQQGVESGMIRSAADSRGRAVILTMWNLGALVLHQHVQRLLGIDLTDPAFGTDPAIASYVGPIYEIYGEGILTETFAAHTRGALVGITGEEEHTHSPSPSEAKPSPTARSKGSP